MRESAFLGAVFVLKALNLPRQARDKHVETVERKGVLCRIWKAGQPWHQETAAAAAAVGAAAAAAAAASSHGNVNRLEALEWYYLDAHGQEQGPFSLGSMRQWYSAGYFSGSAAGEVACAVPLPHRAKRERALLLTVRVQIVPLQRLQPVYVAVARRGGGGCRGGTYCRRCRRCLLVPGLTRLPYPAQNALSLNRFHMFVPSLSW